MTPTQYRPKGGMCMKCIRLHQDCSELPFASMPPIGEYRDEGGLVVRIVRCTEFERAR